MNRLLDEVGIFLLEGLQLLRGAIRTGNNWLRAAILLLGFGPVAATLCRIVFHSPNLALWMAFLPIAGTIIWIFVAGPLWLFVPEILSIGGSRIKTAADFAKTARNKFLSWTGVSLVIGILAAVLPSENSVRWAFIAAGVMIGSALWNVSPPSVRFHWWAWLLVIIVAAMILMGGPAEAKGKLDRGTKAAWSWVSSHFPSPSPKAPPKLDMRTVHYTEAGPGMNIVPGKNEVGIPVGGSTGCYTAPGGWHITEDHDRRFDVGIKVRGKLMPALEVRGDCAKDGVGYVSTTFSGYKVRSFSVINRGKQPASVTVWLRPL